MAVPETARGQINVFEERRPLGVAMPGSDKSTLAPAVAIASDGSLLAVWVEIETGETDGVLIARRFAADGEAIGGRLVVSDDEISANSQPKAATSNDGTFGVAWLSGSGAGRLRFAQLKPMRAGTVDGFEPSVELGNTGALYEVLPVDLVTADRSRFTVVAHRLDGRIGLFRPATGMAAPASSIELEGSSTAGLSVAFDPLSNGLVVAWTPLQGEPLDSDVVYQRFDGLGRPQGARTRANTRLSGNQSDPDLAVFPDGSLVLVWQGPADTEEADVFARRFGPDDEPQTGEVWVDQMRPRYEFGDVRSSKPSVAVSAAGHSFVAWLTAYLDDTGDGGITWTRLGPNLELADGLFGPHITFFPREYAGDPELVTAVPVGGAFGPFTVAVVWVSRYQQRVGYDFEPTAFLRLLKEPTAGDLFPVSRLGVLEGDGPADLLVRRVGGLQGVVSIDYRVVGETATVGVDLVAATGTLQWAANDASRKSIPIEALLDFNLEGIETARIEWSNPGGGWQGRTFEAVELLIDDFDPSGPGWPAIVPFERSVEEGETILVEVRRRGGSSGPLNVTWALESAGARPGVDVVDLQGSLRWVDGDTTPRPLVIPTIEDEEIEGPESFFLSMTADPAVSGVGTGGYITIDDDDPPRGGTFNFRKSFALIGESNGAIAVEVERVGGSEGPAALGYYDTRGDGILFPIPPPFEFLYWDDRDDSPKKLLIADNWSDTVAGEEEVDGTTIELLEVRDAPGAIGPVSSFTVEVVDDDFQPRGEARALSASEVACNRDRLAGLQTRIRMNPAFPDRKSWIVLGPVQSGDITGVATLAPSAGEPIAPTLLSFSTNPEESTLLSNPRRLQLATWSVTRNRAASDLVASASTERFQLFIDPVANPPAVSFSQLLSIDNVDGAAGQAASAKPGRGLDLLLDRCHEGSAYDAHLVSVLTRMLEPVGSADRYHLAVYRGESVNEVRIDLYSQAVGGLQEDAIRYILVVDYDSQGRLARGWLSLDRCDVGIYACFDERDAATGLRFRRPTLQGQPQASASDTLMASDVGGWTEIDFSTLLQSTTWRQPQ